MQHRIMILLTPVVVGTAATSAVVWDHPGHMTTAAIAFAEIERQRPDLIEKIGLLFLRHPDPAPFWVASGEAKGAERVRRVFIEAARWPDDAKWTTHDRPTWHTARWPVVAPDAPPDARKAAEVRQGRPAGQALEALTLNFATMANAESTTEERARALSWVLHIIGDLHQPLHVSDLYSAEYPAGNAAGTMSYVGDPLGTTIPIHLLWDSNVMRTPSLEEVDRNARAFIARHPRSSFPELEEHPVDDPDAFRKWAWESHEVALDWAYDVETVSDPNKDLDADRLVQNMVKFILEGVSPVEDAPAVPDEYWDRLQWTAERRITLAGYRIADLIIFAADRITAEREYIGR